MPLYRKLINRTLITCLVSGVALLTATMLLASASDRQSAAIAAVGALIGDVEAMLETPDAERDTRRGAIKALLNAHFAMDSIAAFSTGPYWRAATPDQRQTYKTVFRDVLVGTILNNFDQLNGLTYTPSKATPKGDKFVIVSGKFTDVTGARPPVAVNWRVLTRTGKPVQVFDIEIENLSLLVTQQQENVAVIRKNKGQFGALIAAMQTRLSAPEPSSQDAGRKQQSD